MTLESFQQEMDKLHTWSKQGCLDGNCQIEKPKGMHTNASCNCNPREFAEHLLWLACEVESAYPHKHQRWIKKHDRTT